VVIGAIGLNGLVSNSTAGVKKRLDMDRADPRRRRSTNAMDPSTDNDKTVTATALPTIAPVCDLVCWAGVWLVNVTLAVIWAAGSLIKPVSPAS